MTEVPFFNRLFKRKEKLSAARLRFLSKTMCIREECAKIAPLFDKSVKELFGLYMSAVWENDEGEKWFLENADDYAQSWFICAFLWEKRLATLKDESECRVIRPKEGTDRYVLLTTETEILNRDTGSIYIGYAPISREFMSLARRAGFENEKGVLVKRVKHCDAPLEERAAEAGAMLLKNGYGVYVKSGRLAARIENEEFTPLAPYRIYAGEEREVLVASFPHDRELYAMFVRNGARWTGTRLEFPVWAFEHLTDVIEICGFRVEEEAKRRADAWKRAETEATVYEGKTQSGDPEKKTAKALFEAFLTREREKLTDLYESDAD